MKKTILILSLVILSSVFVFSFSSAANLPIPETGLPNATVKDILVGVLNWLLAILGIVGIIGFAISGIMYLISTGDDDMIKRAKKGMTYSIVGMIIGLAGTILVQAVERILNGVAF